MEDLTCLLATVRTLNVTLNALSRIAYSEIKKNEI